MADIWSGDCFFERVQVHGGQVDVIPAEVEQLTVIILGGASQEPAVDGRVQSLYPPP